MSMGYVRLGEDAVRQLASGRGNDSHTGAEMIDVMFTQLKAGFPNTKCMLVGDLSYFANKLEQTARFSPQDHGCWLKLTKHQFTKDDQDMLAQVHVLL